MLKAILKSAARRFGYNVSSTDHLGVDMEMDLARLSAEKPLRTIFDVGGNFGQTALRFASAFPSAAIFTFEPAPDTFVRLQEAVAPHPQIKGFNLALGDTRGSAQLNLMSSAGHHTLGSNPGALGTVEVAVDTVDAVADANGVEDIDLLKIDVEGHELQVLAGARRRLREGRVRFVFAECFFPSEEDCPHTSFFDLHQRLAAEGFCFVAYYGEGFLLEHGNAHGNALFALRSKLPRSAPGRARNIA